MSRISPSRFSVLLIGALTMVLAVSCASQPRLADNILRAGQVDIQLPPGWKVTPHGVISPAQPGSASQRATGDATTTIPLNKQNPTSEFFQATSAFSGCLKGLGVTFVGVPDAKNPSSPANDPNYLKNLETCAAQSHIAQALKDFQASQDNLTPKQIEQENQAYLRWRTCMIGRGWTIPAPTPDSKGRLFSITGAGGGASRLTPPPGEDAFNSPDIQVCTKQSQLSG